MIQVDCTLLQSHCFFYCCCICAHRLRRHIVFPSWSTSWFNSHGSWCDCFSRFFWHGELGCWHGSNTLSCSPALNLLLFRVWQTPVSLYSLAPVLLSRATKLAIGALSETFDRSTGRGPRNVCCCWTWNKRPFLGVRYVVSCCSRGRGLLVGNLAASHCCSSWVVMLWSCFTVADALVACAPSIKRTYRSLRVSASYRCACVCFLTQAGASSLLASSVRQR